MNDFGKTLNTIRRNKGLTMEETGLRCGFGGGVISLYESGKRHPTRKGIDQLVTGLRLSVRQKDELLVAAGFFPEDRRVLEYYRSLA